MGNTEEKLVTMRQGKGDMEQVMEKIRDQKTAELANTVTELELEKLKLEIQRLRDQQKPVSKELGTDLLGQIMRTAQVSPERAKQFLDSLDEESIAKLSMLSAAGSSGGIGNYLPLLKGGTNMQDIIAVVKLLQDNRPPKESGTDLKGIAEIFKAGVEAAKSQAPSKSEDPMQTFKYVMETYVAPFQKTLSEKDDTIWKERLDKIASQNVNPIEWLKQQKDMAETLGFKSSGTSELDLKRQEMHDVKELDMERLKWEQQKWMIAKDADKEKYQMIERTIKNVTEGPLGKALERIGGAGADRLRGAAPKEVKTTKINCPNCHKDFIADADAAIVVCGLCGTQLSKVSAESPPAEAVITPTPTPQAEAPKPSEPEPQQAA